MLDDPAGSFPSLRAVLDPRAAVEDEVRTYPFMGISNGRVFVWDEDGKRDIGPVEVRARATLIDAQRRLWYAHRAARIIGAAQRGGRYAQEIERLGEEELEALGEWTLEGRKHVLAVSRLWAGLHGIRTVEEAQLALAVLQPLVHAQNLAEMRTSGNEALRLAAAGVEPAENPLENPTGTWLDYPCPPFWYTELTEEDQEVARAQEDVRLRGARLVSGLRERGHEMSDEDAQRIVRSVDEMEAHCLRRLGGPWGRGIRNAILQSEYRVAVLSSLLAEHEPGPAILRILCEQSRPEVGDLLMALVSSEPEIRASAASLLSTLRGLVIPEQSLLPDNVVEAGADVMGRELLAAADERESREREARIEAVISEERRREVLRRCLAYGDLETRSWALGELGRAPRSAPPGVAVPEARPRTRSP